MWLCTAADDIVYAHSNTVNTNCIMLIHKESNFQLCTNTVCTGNKNRLFDILNIKLEKTAQNLTASTLMRPKVSNSRPDKQTRRQKTQAGLHTGGS